MGKTPSGGRRTGTVASGARQFLLQTNSVRDRIDDAPAMAPVPDDGVHDDSRGRGHESTLLFTSGGVHVTFDGRLMGDIPNPQFAELMLATFIGAVPPTPRLKRELLGFRD
jgi:hypothetical protein